MKTTLLLLFTAVFISGCATKTGATVTGYSTEGNSVTLLNGDDVISSLPAPVEADRIQARTLHKSILGAVINFIGQPDYKFTIEAARQYGKILLLDVRPGTKADANEHLVYDFNRKAVVGHFKWYSRWK